MELRYVHFADVDLWLAGGWVMVDGAYWNDALESYVFKVQWPAATPSRPPIKRSALERVLH